MTTYKKVAGTAGVNESWGPALKESGMDFQRLQNPEDFPKSSADCFLIDARDSKWFEGLASLRNRSSAPVLMMVSENVDRSKLVDLRERGAQGTISENTPAEEIVVRVRAMLSEKGQRPQKIESRAARRVWFQQEVEFEAFGKKHKSWSTTLSQTGIFLRTSLSFPLYTVIHLRFALLGDQKDFECDGVIVRQEVEGDIRGVGIMFQNLKGENVRLLESFLEIYQ